MINIHGIGWIDAKGYGCIAKGTRVAYEGDTGFGGLSKSSSPIRLNISAGLIEYQS